ncbi:MAG: hypothetical protein SFY81_01820 [Verrucomicrobiota bacterium]|nr:hypothetical protein [Verrucomicrobiota bacterium]
MKFLIKTIVAGLGILPCLALSPAEENALDRALAKFPAPEIPAKVLETIQRAHVNERKEVAITAVTLALQRHRSIAPTLLSSLNKAVPDLFNEIAQAANQTLSARSKSGTSTVGSSGKGQEKTNSGKGNKPGDLTNGHGNGNGNNGSNNSISDRGEFRKEHRGNGPTNPNIPSGPPRKVSGKGVGPYGELPNGKPRHFPPDPPHRPVDPPGPRDYAAPRR